MAYKDNHTRQNRDDQADFAQRLVKAVGYDAAISQCYENQWLGILIHIRQMQRTYRSR